MLETGCVAVSVELTLSSSVGSWFDSTAAVSWGGFRTCSSIPSSSLEFLKL